MGKKKAEFENSNGSNEQDLQICIREINNAKDKIEENIINIGQWLVMAKSIVKHGDWENWLEENVGYTKMTASRYMKAYNLIKKIPDELTFKVQELGGTKVIELSTLKVEQVEEIVTNNDVENISVRELKEIVKEYKKPNKKKAKESKSNIDVIFETPTATITTDIIIKTDTNKIFLDTCNLNNELRNRVGSDEDLETTLITRYEAKEINHQELSDVIVANKLNLPIFFKEKSLEEYLDRFSNNFYSDYEQYDYEADKREDRTYYSIFARELEWEEVIKCWDEEDEDAMDWSKSSHTDDSTYQLAEAYVDTSRYLCIYKDYKLLGTYRDGEWDDINRLGIYDRRNIPVESLKELEALYNKLENQIKDYEERNTIRQAKEQKEREKRQAQQKKYDEAFNTWKTSYQPYSMGKYSFEDIYDNKGDIKNYKLWREMCDFVSQQKRANYDSWKNYDFGNMFGNSNSLAIKEEDKDIYKKIYRASSLKLHPDVLKDDGHAMQILNQLKEQWGI